MIIGAGQPFSHLPAAPPSPRAHRAWHSASTSHGAPSLRGTAHVPFTHLALVSQVPSGQGSPTLGAGASVHLPPAQRPLPQARSTLHAPPGGTRSRHARRLQ